VEVDEADHPLIGAPHDGAERPRIALRVAAQLVAPEREESEQLALAVDLLAVRGREIVRDRVSGEAYDSLAVVLDQRVEELERDERQVEPLRADDQCLALGRTDRYRSAPLATARSYMSSDSRSGRPLPP
jgi:hypothetical protein